MLNAARNRRSLQRMDPFKILRKTARLVISVIPIDSQRQTILAGRTFHSAFAQSMLLNFRIETPRVVSASNLFKYCAPGHGLLVFRHHHPLEFDSATVHDLMQCTQEWIKKASKQHPTALYPLLIWNCLERSGGSQFHGHAQIMLSEVQPMHCELPSMSRLGSFTLLSKIESRPRVLCFIVWR